MNCPTCHHPIPTRPEFQGQVRQNACSHDVLFEICPRCGVVWIDFGVRRPRLHTSVEAQVARWDNLKQLLDMTGRLLEIQEEQVG